jgi:hypothetical protein
MSPLKISGYWNVSVRVGATMLEQAIVQGPMAQDAIGNMLAGMLERIPIDATELQVVALPVYYIPAHPATKTMSKALAEATAFLGLK